MAKIIQMATKPSIPVYEVLEEDVEMAEQSFKQIGNSWRNPGFKYEKQNAASHANSDNFRQRQIKRMREAGWKK